MASQSFIIRVETAIVDARASVEDATQAYRTECGHTAGHAGPAHLRDRPYPANHDVWSTLLVNTRVLRDKLDELLALAEKKPPVQ